MISVIEDKMNKEIPVLFKKKEECFGCSACYAICVEKSIEMLPDEEGFLYPHINEQKCVGCKQCLIVCPMKLLVTTEF